MTQICICNLTPEVRDILKILWETGEMTPKYCGKAEKWLLWSHFSSFPQYFVTCYKISMLKTGTKFSLRGMRLFEVSEVEITRVDYISYVNSTFTYLCKVYTSKQNLSR